MAALWLTFPVNDAGFAPSVASVRGQSALPARAEMPSGWRGGRIVRVCGVRAIGALLPTVKKPVPATLVLHARHIVRWDR